MRKINKLQSKLAIIPLLVLLISFVACEKDESAGPPSIHRVRVIPAAQADSIITQVRPGDMIVIEGVNLANAEHVFFNDFPATFNPIYNTATHLIIQVPGKTPTPDKDPNVTNEIRVVTKGGSASYTITIEPPPPSISRVVNENAKPGTTMTVVGSYFGSVKGIQLPGGLSVTDFTINTSETEISFVLPEEIGSTSGKLILESMYGNDTTASEINKITGMGVIHNSDDITNYWWNATRISNQGDTIPEDYTTFPESRGKFLINHIRNMKADDSEWYAEGRGAFYGGLPVVLDATALKGLNSADSLANYALKFEINTKVAWNNNFIFRITFNGKETGEFYTYNFEPYKDDITNLFDTRNKWVTITIPLSEFKEAINRYEQFPIKENANNLQTLGQIFDNEGKYYKSFIFRSTSSAAIPEMHFATDNVRIVRHKKD